ncbi:MAG: DMT family transporter [Rhizobiaceae bacterium]|nr:DMT family transporter [Rhizobiaceae bacterium]MCV0407846.1 DMT family transporter [Rhizobiaceae bacterium]
MLGFAAFVAGSFTIGALAAPHIEPAAINAARFLFGTLVMACAAALIVRGGIQAPRAIWRYGVLGALMALFFITMFVALRLTDPVSAAAVFTLMPLMSAFFGWLFLGQVPRIVVLVSLVLAATGAVWMIFRGDLAALLAFDVGPGEAIFFVGCIGHAAYAPLVRKFNRGEPVMIFTLWSLAGTGLAIALWGVRDIAATDWTALPPVVWIAIAYLATFTTAGTTFLVQFASMRLPASKVLAYAYLNPCFVILYEGVAGHGWTSPWVAIGALVTIVALLVMALGPDR